jgi:hypothetical protein
VETVDTTYLLSRTPYWNNQKFRELLQLRPHICVALFGTNDSRSNVWPYIGDRFVESYCAFVDTVRAVRADCRILVCIPPPAGPNPYLIQPDVLRDSIAPLIRSVAEAKGLQTVDLYSPFLDRMAHLPDGVHPDSVGTRIIADAVYAAIQNPLGIQPEAVRSVTIRAHSFGSSSSASVRALGPSLLQVGSLWVGPNGRRVPPVGRGAGMLYRVPRGDRDCTTNR